MNPFWYRKSWHIVTLFLLPLSFLFALVSAIRRWLYQVELLKVHRFPIPVIVVGNITVGGTGKTPFVIGLIKFLKEQGYQPGIVSRGVGGKKHFAPLSVNVNDLPEAVGDEALLLAQSTQCPMVICIDRVAAVKQLLEQHTCDIVISDDGLQHYSLGRDVEIVMVDHVRQFGNQLLLPAGPLRESVKRLKKVDFVVSNGGCDKEAYTMALECDQVIALNQVNQAIPIATFASKKVHAVAAIGHPERFFDALRSHGFDIIPHSFPDHYLYQPQDLQFNDALPVLMTAKDAVKYQQYADSRHWYVHANAKLSTNLIQALQIKLTSLRTPHDEKNRTMYSRDPITHMQCDE